MENEAFIKKFQKKSDEKLLAIAIKDNHLPKESKIENLTTGVRQKMIDSYILKDAIRGNYLPKDSGVEDLTIKVRQRMANYGELKKYSPNGSRRTKDFLISKYAI
ncbi:hypothetical protein KAJ87_04520 [Candidatus Pacearchaeota archaeon]|nr:hypothetical protein [Candidatus Pacearchaeota archaeon]